MPEQKRFGRLFDQHTQTIDSFDRAVLECPITERPRIQSIHHVVNQAAGDCIRGNLGQGADQPRRCAIDDDVERFSECSGVGNSQARIFEPIDQRSRTSRGSICHNQALRPPPAGAPVHDQGNSTTSATKKPTATTKAPPGKKP